MKLEFATHKSSLQLIRQMLQLLLCSFLESLTHTLWWIVSAPDRRGLLVDKGESIISVYVALYVQISSGN